MMKRQAGFTLIELVVVILILSVLAATALPRFMNVNDQANEAAVAGTGGGFSEAVALAHAQWVANGSTTTAGLIAGYGSAAGTVWGSTTGWPVDNDSATLNCVDVWNGLLQGGAPSVGGATDDYTTVAAGASGVCTYTYNGATGMTIVYDSTDGSVTVDAEI